MWRKRSWVQREILRQARFYKIPVGKLLKAAAQRGVPLGVGMAYLKGEVGRAHADWTVGDEFFLAISDITWAMALEERQVEELRRRWYVAPRHPGVEGREGRVLGLSREAFLDLCKLSQPALVRRALRALKTKRRRVRHRPRRTTGPQPAPGGALAA